MPSMDFFTAMEVSASGLSAERMRMNVAASNLANAQTGTGPTTNIADRGGAVGPALLKITTTVGATPTCTYAIEGSPDGTNWYSVPYADSATPGTFVVTTFAITSATTKWVIVQRDAPVRYLRITFSANTNVTNTVDVFTY